MNAEQFWWLVDETRKGCTSRYCGDNLKEQNRRYRELLEAMTPPQLLDWQRSLEERLAEAYRWDLWAAAALIRDGCSTGAFQDFRAWLVAQGKAAFSAALRDPETLADNAELQDDDSAQYPAFLSIPRGIYKTKTGQDMPATGVVLPKEPAGKKLVEDLAEINADNVDTLAGRLPRLAEAFQRDEWFTDREPEPYHPAPKPAVAVPPMAEDRFWALIEESRRLARAKKPANGDVFFERQLEAMPDILRKLSPDELIAYDRRFWAYHRQAYRWELWGAAYWMHGGCSDDGFIDFRATLITLGKDLFLQVLKDPDVLAELIERKDVPAYLQLEGFQYLAGRVYKEKTGYDAIPDMPDEERGPAKPPGKKFDFENDAVMGKRYPRLVAKFPDMGE